VEIGGGEQGVVEILLEVSGGVADADGCLAASGGEVFRRDGDEDGFADHAFMPGVGKLMKQAAKMQKQMEELQEELANTEDRIASARRFYNANVRDLNQLCEQFPTNIVANVFGFERADYFELASDQERVVPHVALGS